MNRKNLYVLSFILIVFISLMAGCSGIQNGESESGSVDSENNGDGAEDANKDITVGVSDNFISMDPHDSNDTLGYSAQKGMMEGLVGFDEEMEVIPRLAEDWEASDDAKEFTFTLRDDVEFHDGEPFNAEAVKVNMDRLKDPDNNLKRHSMAAVIDEVEVIDEFEVKFILKEPFGAMINNFAHPSMMMHSPKALEEEGDDVALNPVGTGPFEFDEWKQGDHLTMKKNDNYWKEGYPKVDSVTFKPVPENGSRVAMLQTGEADFIYPVPTEQVETLEDEDGIEVNFEESIVTQYASMNTRKEPFDKKEVRQAVNYAIDQDAFIEVVQNGHGTPMDSIVAPKVQFYDAQTPYDYNPEKAKELLKEAGYEDGFEAKIWSGNTSDAIKAAEFIQQQLSEVNIDLEVTSMESGTLSDSLWDVEDPDDAEVDMYYGGWSSSTGDADWGLRPLIGGEENFPPASYNVAFYDNEEVNDDITKALETADNDQREEAYEHAQEIIWDEAPWTFLALAPTKAGKRENLEGIYLLPDNSLSFEELEVK